MAVWFCGSVYRGASRGASVPPFLLPGGDLCAGTASDLHAPLQKNAHICTNLRVGYYKNNYVKKISATGWTQGWKLIIKNVLNTMCKNNLEMNC